MPASPERAFRRQTTGPSRELFVRRALSFGRERLPLLSHTPHRGRHTRRACWALLHVSVSTHSENPQPKVAPPSCEWRCRVCGGEERPAQNVGRGESGARHHGASGPCCVCVVVQCVDASRISLSLSLTAPQGARCVVLRAASTQAHAHTDRGRATPMAEWSAMATFLERQ